MAKSTAKTVETKESVTAFLNKVSDATKKKDCFAATVPVVVYKD